MKEKSENNKTRCFVALDLPREVRNEIFKIQKLIKDKKLFDGKLIDKENLHLTLKFLREIDDKQIREVRERLREIKFNEFEVRLGEIGVFSKKFVKIIWIKLENTQELQKQIDEKLRDLFESEFRFMSHITIARVRRVYDKNGFLKYLKQLKIPSIKFNINRFFLKKSELFESGPVYNDLAEYKLEKI